MAPPDHLSCPVCGYPNARGASKCPCGHQFPADPTRPAAKPKPKLWLAALPGVIVALVAMGTASYRFSQVSRVIGGGGQPAAENPKGCIETYGVTLSGSEFYVSERDALAGRRKNKPREISTVVRGMARNDCGKPLKRVRILIQVRDGEGKRGSAWAEIANLGVGQVKPFQRAWMGRITDYEIARVE